MSELLDMVEVAALLGTSKRTVIRYRDSGVLPPAVRVGPRLVRWRRCDLEAWIHSGCIPARLTEGPRRGRARA